MGRCWSETKVYTSPWTVVVRRSSEVEQGGRVSWLWVREDLRVPDAADHRVAMHRLVQQRTKDGLPTWDQTVDVSSVWGTYGGETEEGLEEFRDRVVAVLRDTRWYREHGPTSELHAVVEELSDVDSVDYFNRVWEVVYDLADYDRVWIKTIA